MRASGRRMLQAGGTDSMKMPKLEQVCVSEDRNGSSVGGKYWRG